METGKAVIRILQCLPQAARKSMTYDSDGEFELHPDNEAVFQIPVYFCDPHSPWQHGTIENTNGILCRDMQRKYDIKNYTARGIGEIIWAVNSIPLKYLGFKTPAEVFIENLKCCSLCENPALAKNPLKPT